MLSKEAQSGCTTIPCSAEPSLARSRQAIEKSCAVEKPELSLEGRDVCRCLVVAASRLTRSMSVPASSSCRNSRCSPKRNIGTNLAFPQGSLVTIRVAGAILLLCPLNLSRSVMRRLSLRLIWDTEHRRGAAKSGKEDNMQVPDVEGI